MIPSDDPRTKALLAARADHSRQRAGDPGGGMSADRALLFESGTLARINHNLRRETPREAGWDKAGEELREGCMGSYCPNRDSSPTQSQPASRKSQQMACDFSGLAIAVPEAGLLGVVRDPRLTPVPGSAVGCLGAVAFRSRFFDVFSLFGLLGIEAPGGVPGHAVICTARKRAFGLWCGVPSGFVTASPDSSTEVSATWPPALRQRIAVGAFLLDLNELLRLPVFSSTNEL